MPAARIAPAMLLPAIAPYGVCGARDRAYHRRPSRPCTSSSTYGRPLSLAASIACCTSSTRVVSCVPTRRITSPGPRPSCAAAPPGSTPATTTPLSSVACLYRARSARVSATSPKPSSDRLEDGRGRVLGCSAGAGRAVTTGVRASVAPARRPKEESPNRQASLR